MNMPSPAETYFPDEETKKTYINRMRRLAEMMRHPGWADFSAYVQQQIAASISNAASSDSPHKSALHIGAAHALKVAINWPVEEINATQYAVKQDEET